METRKEKKAAKLRRGPLRGGLHGSLLQRHHLRDYLNIHITYLLYLFVCLFLLKKLNTHIFCQTFPCWGRQNRI